VGVAEAAKCGLVVESIVAGDSSVGDMFEVEVSDSP
jgi:hypothetical protein